MRLMSRVARTGPRTASRAPWIALALTLALVIVDRLAVSFAPTDAELAARVERAPGTIAARRALHALIARSKARHADIDGLERVLPTLEGEDRRFLASVRPDLLRRGARTVR